MAGTWKRFPAAKETSRPEAGSPSPETRSFKAGAPSFPRYGSGADGVVVDVEREEKGASRRSSIPVLVVYPRNVRGGAPVDEMDVETLRPRKLINDSIVNFYSRTILHEVCGARRSGVLMFESFFLQMLLS